MCMLKMPASQHKLSAGTFLHFHLIKKTVVLYVGLNVCVHSKLGSCTCMYLYLYYVCVCMAFDLPLVRLDMRVLVFVSRQ